MNGKGILLIYKFENKKVPSNYYKVMKRLRKRIDCKILAKGIIFFPTPDPYYVLDTEKGAQRKREVVSMANVILEYGGEIQMFAVNFMLKRKGKLFYQELIEKSAWLGLGP